MVTFDAFRSLATDAIPPAGLSPALQALWWAGQGGWDRAHDCAQRHEGEPDCDLVHAHLHRREGDLENATYWYSIAGRPVPTATVEEEWTSLATAMLARSEP